MNHKIPRITLLLPIIAISFLIGISVLMRVNSSTFQLSNVNFISEESELQIPGDFRQYDILSITACTCLGVTYADEIAPVILVISPPNNSLIYPNTTIYLECSDNFPAMTGGIPFVPKLVYYGWNDATSNM